MNVSVYIPSYNQRRFLAQAIESVLAQTLRPHQVIIVDDSSTDGSQNVIATYTARHPRLITAIYHDRNRGIPRTRNDALQAVTGDCVTYVDADDRLLPTKLEREAEALAANPDAHVAFSDYVYTDSQGAVTRR
jgi:glycosyltransferase involved in cell wall biosynthesis